MNNLALSCRAELVLILLCGDCRQFNTDCRSTATELPGLIIDFWKMVAEIACNPGLLWHGYNLRSGYLEGRERVQMSFNCLYICFHSELHRVKTKSLMQTINVIALLLIIGVRISPRQLQ